MVITRLQDLGGAHGYSQPGRITILNSLAPADSAAVLVHEFAHELLHQRGDERPASKTVRETEAEAVAFIVSTAIGIRSSVDATDYIQCTTAMRTHFVNRSIASKRPPRRSSAPCRSRRLRLLVVRQPASRPDRCGDHRAGCAPGTTPPLHDTLPAATARRL